MNLRIDFTKCDDPIEPDGTCSGGGRAFWDDIIFTLTSPAGTTVDIVLEDTYDSRSDSGDRVVVDFDDSAATQVGGDMFVSGAFRPVGFLSDLVGENPTGIWTLFFADASSPDPLSLNAWELTVTTVPEPNTALLVALGLVALGALRRA